MSELLNGLVPCPDCRGNWDPAEHGAVLVHGLGCPALHGVTTSPAPVGGVPLVPEGVDPVTGRVRFRLSREGA